MTEHELKAICEREGATPRLYRRLRGKSEGAYWHLTRRATRERRGGAVDVYLCTATKLPELSEGELLGKLAHLKQKEAAARPAPAPEEPAPPKDGSYEHWPRVLIGKVMSNKSTIHQRRADNPDVTLCGVHWREVSTSAQLLTAARTVTCGRCRKSMGEE
jgi:hypothetical protein